jgi:hypothetical protein
MCTPYMTATDCIQGMQEGNAPAQYYPPVAAELMLARPSLL